MGFRKSTVLGNNAKKKWFFVAYVKYIFSVEFY